MHGKIMTESRLRLPKDLTMRELGCSFLAMQKTKAASCDFRRLKPRSCHIKTLSAIWLSISLDRLAATDNHCVIPP
ncbi:g6727 [Coccomyxa elongata]